MSAAMATDQTMRQYCVDETSCGALCQHPQCWASMRRCEKGRPRLKDPVQTSWDATEDEGALPTLKVQNLLADSGLGARGEYPTQRSGEGTAMRSLHHRSSSAPAVDFENGQKHKFPYTPYTSPLGVRSTSARSVPSSLTERRPGKAKSVEVRELFELDELQSNWQQAFVPSHVYIWCPSKKAYERQLQRERGPTPPIDEQSEASKPVAVKDMTDLMVPKAPKDKTRRAKKMKKKPSRITPTGGRPYTHPSRSSPVHRRTLPAEMDESISQLLSLPRDILMDVLVHIKNSDSLDKQKVQILLSRLMPLIHFDQNQPTHRAISPTPLLASGILQNKKMSLLQGRPHQADRDPETLAAAAAGATGAAHARNPFFLDDSLISAMTTSTYTALAQQLPVEESVAVNQEVGQTGRMARQQPLGPIQAGPAHDTAPMPQSQHIKNKLTSVSTKSLPPLAPGSRPTKPFDYKGAKSLDLTLGPLPTPDHLSPEKPSTPRSDKASTLFVTLPSVLSPDRTEMSTPLQPYGRVSAGRGHSERLALQYLHDTPSPIASEDFHPLHAVSPSLSTGVPKAPLGTPATNINQPFHPTSASHQRPGRSPSPTKQSNQGNGGAPQREVNTASGPVANPSNPDALGTIREAHSEMTTSYPGTSAMDTSLPTSPVKQGVTPISTPWGNCTSITTGVISDRASRSPVPPVTPQPSTATPEPWPIVDERDFMTSPEKPREMANGQMVNMATPMAPPPSPEPQELKNEFEFAVNDMSKSGMTSLTPLVEEGEEEEEEEEELAKDDRKEDNLEGNSVAEEQAIETKRDESASKPETEEIEADIIGNQIHESTCGEPSKPQTENPVDDAPPEEDQVVTVSNQDTAEERQDGTAADTLPSTEIHSSVPVGADDEMLDSHIGDQLNPDLTQDSAGEAVVDRESASAVEPNVAMDETPNNEENYNTSDSAPSKEDKMDDQNDGKTLADQESRDHPIIPTENENTEETLDTANAPTNETQALIPPDEDDKEDQNHAANNDQVCLSAKNGNKPGSILEEDQHGTSLEEEEPGDAKTKEDSVDDVQKQIADLTIDDGAVAEDNH